MSTVTIEGTTVRASFFPSGRIREVMCPVCLRWTRIQSAKDAANLELQPHRETGGKHSPQCSGSGSMVEILTDDGANR